MRKMITALLLASAGLGVASAANAADGCGPGAHRGPHGRCHPNGGPGYGRQVLVVDRFYPGRGYWDGQRYWHHRERAHDGWRYR